MLLAVPEEGSRKPPVLGFGCRLRNGVLSCEALYVHKTLETGVLIGELHAVGAPVRRVHLAWSTVEPGLYKHAEIDLEPNEKGEA